MPPKCSAIGCENFRLAKAGERYCKDHAADPAQSAPSAEQLAMKKNLAERDAENFIYDRLGFAFKAINSSLTVTVFKPVKVMSLSQSDRKWDVVYLMDKAWDLLVELAAEKQAAALRTAELERERNEALELNRTEREATLKHQNFILEITHIWKTRAETAESALRDAKKLLDDSIQGLRVDLSYMSNCYRIENKSWDKVEQARALLTVAAQTPEEK